MHFRINKGQLDYIMWIFIRMPTSIFYQQKDARECLEASVVAVTKVCWQESKEGKEKHVGSLTAPTALGSRRCPILPFPRSLRQEEPGSTLPLRQDTGLLAGGTKAPAPHQPRGSQQSPWTWRTQATWTSPKPQQRFLTLGASTSSCAVQG